MSVSVNNFGDQMLSFFDRFTILWFVIIDLHWDNNNDIIRINALSSWL